MALNFWKKGTKHQFLGQSRPLACSLGPKGPRKPREPPYSNLVLGLDPYKRGPIAMCANGL